MRKGFWRLLGRMPALALAVAVAPAAMADGPYIPSGYPTDPAAAGPSAIPVVDMHAFRPIQPVAADSMSLTNYAVELPDFDRPAAGPACPRQCSTRRSRGDAGPNDGASPGGAGSHDGLCAGDLQFDVLPLLLLRTRGGLHVSVLTQ